MDAAQEVTLFVPGTLRTFCEGKAQLTLTVTGLPNLLMQLERHYPALHSNVCDETGRVRPHLNVFVNADNVRDRQGLATAVASGDVITILPAVSGG
ncbi:MAG: molybdopterin synthase sulfur carrier subunit [Candidatus Eisenbacteria bacterium]|uniref:Molybdopterin synthase sulfur carrier subunit n=1 Tax=Eiseniibacteriota bacterium TaxID=2212470 RepID=A0A849SF33_UNCEI|nr:molybdopterin synthase sulfur carrier subunit [Candidatus Eisenbacteria bacterium]